jgi:uncharacterized membrane protein
LLGRIEQLERAQKAPATGWAARPPATRRPQPVSKPPPPAEPPRPQLSLEDLLGGRVLAWVGGIAVVVGIAFFLVMAASRGWIDETTRVLLAFVGATALLVAGGFFALRKKS